MLRARHTTCGLTLVETALAVSVVGIVLAVFIPTFVAQIETSKTTEAAELVSELYARTAAYYSGPHEGGTRCLPSAAGPTPTIPTASATPVDWLEESSETPSPSALTWRALGFAPNRDTRFSYEFHTSLPGCDRRVSAGRTLFTVRARGDLDGDGTFSLFERVGTLNADGLVHPRGPLFLRRKVE